MPRIQTIVPTICGLAACTFACLWDSETMRVEREGFPSEIELIVGAVRQRPKGWHEWRIKYSLIRIADKTHDRPEDYDNLAVSLDKLHKDDSAVEVMRSSRQRFGLRYETLANLGTFHFHLGKFEEGLPYIDSALELNPDAHFGRERYQKWLVEYLMASPRQIPVAPAKSAKDIGTTQGEHGFSAWVAAKLGRPRLDSLEREKAIKGVLGMMRFGNNDSPILLEAYADLARGRRSSLGRGLAVKAYMAAARVVTPVKGLVRGKPRDTTRIDSTKYHEFRRLARITAGGEAVLVGHIVDLHGYQNRLHYAKISKSGPHPVDYDEKIRALEAGDLPDPSEFDWSEGSLYSMREPEEHVVPQRPRHRKKPR